MKWPAHGYGLRGDALEVAEDCVGKFPIAVITSGRRAIADQASAMALNEARAPGWVAATYLDSAPKRALVRWLTANPGRAQVALFDGFLTVLRGFTVKELGALSLHLSGEAFDVRPVLTPAGLDVRDWLAAAAVLYGGKFLDKEGGLVRWHWQARRR